MVAELRVKTAGGVGAEVQARSRKILHGDFRGWPNLVSKYFFLLRAREFALPRPCSLMHAYRNELLVSNPVLVNLEHPHDDVDRLELKLSAPVKL